MLKRLIATITFFVSCIAIYAQGTCTINGSIANDKLANGKKVKKVSLVHTDEYGCRTEIATAKVKKGKYKFSYNTAKDEPVVMYTITGFDGENCIELFIEPGEVTVNTANASEPYNSNVKGTAVNDLFTEYKSVCKEYESEDAAMLIKREAERIKFLIEHNESPMTPLEMERSVMPYLSAPYAEQMVKCLSAKLHNHPYYISFRNAVLASNLKVGNEAPNIAIAKLDGTKARLADYSGKYILLDFWTSTNDRSMEEREVLKQLYDVIKEKQDKFIIVSLSLDKDVDVWANTLNDNDLNKAGWVHGNDPTGKSLKFFNAEEEPRMILLDPERRTISLDIKSDEVIERVEQILAGDLYYLDQEK